MHKIIIIIKEVQKAAKYYRDNAETQGENARNKYRNLSEKENDKKYQGDRCHMNIDSKERLKRYQ